MLTFIVFLLYHDIIFTGSDIMASFNELKKKYEELIHKYKESTKIDTQYYNLKRYAAKEQLEDFLKKNDIKQTYDRDFAIYELIFNYTIPSINADKLNELANYILKIDPDCKIYFNKNEKFNTEELIIKTNDNEIKTIIFSNLTPIILQEFPNLITFDRANNCFDDSLELSLTLGIPNYLVTGLVYGLTDKPFLHSFIETKLHGEEVVIDYTMNAIINKDAYYKFRHVKPLEKIKDSDINNDKNKYYKIFNLINIKASMYNLFRDEIINDFEKNNYEDIVKK